MNDQAVPVLIKLRAESYPEGILVQDVQGDVLSNSAFHAASLRVADTLVSLGVAPGECVATYMYPRLESHLFWIGICWAQGMEVPINPEFKGNTLIYGLNDSKAKVLIACKASLPEIEKVYDQIRYLEHIVLIEEEKPETPLAVTCYCDLERSAAKIQHPEPKVTDPYAVIYTSGTTGPSKGVVSRWRNIQTSIMHFLEDDLSDVQDIAYYSPWPSFHASGKVGLVFACESGGRLVIRDRLSVSNFWEDIRKFGCTHTQTLGLADFLLAQPKESDDARNPLVRVLMQPTTPFYRDFEHRFGVRVSTGWGMTEIGMPITTNNPPNHLTCGKLSPLYEVRLVDHGNREVPVGQIGQLIIRGREEALLFREYYGKPEATKKAWRNGWFYTGDALRQDENGYFYFADRVSDYVRVRGNNVSSLEVESEIREHPQVLECAAIGVPSTGVSSSTPHRAVASEDEIKIVVRKAEDSQLTERVLYDFLLERMPKYMLPRFIEFVQDYPRTPTGKVQKKILRETHVAEITWDCLRSCE